MTSRERLLWPWLLTGAAVLVAATAALLTVLGTSLSVQYGLPPAEVVVDATQPAARLIATLASAALVGNLLLAAVLSPGDPSGVVSATGYAGLRAARLCALVQVPAAGTVAVLTVAENSGMGPDRLLTNGAALLIGLQQIQPATGWLLTALVGLAVAVLCDWTLSWRGSVGLLLMSLLGLLPATLTADTNAERSHDIVGDSLTLHVVGAVLWLGSALVTALHIARRADNRPVILRRHRRIATWCLLGVGGTGVISSAYAVDPADLTSSGYGLLVLLSCALLVALASVAAFARTALDRSATRLVLLELVLLAVTAALGTGLARSAPPSDPGQEISTQTYQLGYDLPDHLTALDLLLRWRPDLIFDMATVLAAVFYLLGVRRMRVAGRPWPVRHTVAWLAGCGVLLIATSSGIGSYAPAMFSMHMVQHMLLATLAPALLVLGHGAGLAVAATSPGMSRRITSLIGSGAVRFAGHPMTAWLAVAATLFGLYPTGLYTAIVAEHWAHLGMNVAVFLTGLALFWSVLGHGAPHRELPAIGQLVLVFAVMALHATFSAWLLGQAEPLAGEFYRPLRLPFVTDLLADQRLGAVLGWLLGELPVILAVVVLILRWTTDDRRPRSAPKWQREREPVTV